MNKGIYAVLDTVANTLVGGLHLHAHPAAAIRMFQDAAGDSSTVINKHLADFNLLQVGEIDEATGVMVELTDSAGYAPVVVLTGASLLALREDSAK